jgi:hypothetical protein
MAQPKAPFAGREQKRLLMDAEAYDHWVEKGRKGGRGAYHGAHWHMIGEANFLFHGLPVRNLCVRTAIHFPNGGRIAELLERIIPSTFPTGSFLLVSGDII